MLELRALELKGKLVLFESLLKVNHAFLFQENRAHTLFPGPPTKAAKNLGHYIQSKYKKTLKGEDRGQASLGIRHLRNNTVVHSLGCLFWLVCPIAKEVGNWKHQWHRQTNKNVPTKVSDLTSEPRMGQCSKTESFQTITSLLWPKNTGKQIVALLPPTEVQVEWRPQCPLSLAYNEVSHPLCRIGAREGEIGSRDFHHSPEVTRPLSPVVSVKTA